MTRTQAPTFEERARQHASDWKQRTPTVPAEARVPAPYIRDRNPVGCYPYCLPPALSAYNLLPEVRAEALKRFAAARIAWQASIDGRPTNHLLSSQVQCVNALMPMSGSPRLVVAAFGEVLRIGEPLTVEDGRYLTFEYIGATDHLGEAKPGIARERGRFCTSADAAIRYRRPRGGIEVALIEWKYTESYDGRPLAKSRSDRLGRYRPLFEDPDGPLRTDVIPYADLFVEPFYQLMRQQLLAHAMERSGELDADTVRVLHVAPAANPAVADPRQPSSGRGDPLRGMARDAAPPQPVRDARLGAVRDGGNHQRGVRREVRARLSARNNTAGSEGPARCAVRMPVTH